jgi:peptidyl-prolyl cis-trans isomerase A (cyclophilin A)/peptidyl-prolyl cis-trans isomerase B (cyclophilin B)
MHRLLSLLFAVALAIAAGPSLAVNPQVELETSACAIKLELYPDATPKTVENFLKYVNAGHYNGTQFHRVIKGFMIQGGGYDSEFRQRPTRPPIAIEAEQSVKAGLSNKPGTVAMARTGDPNSAQSQFFINVGDNKRLDFRSPDAQGYGYTVFGKVISGMDVVEKIAQAPTGAAGPFPTDVPTERVVIKSARVVTPAS